MENNMNPCIPYRCSNIYDYGIYTNRGILDIYNENMFSIIKIEASIFNECITENGIINESGFMDKIKEIKDKVIAGFKKMLEKIKEFFAKLVKTIKYIFSKAKTEVFSKATKKDFEDAVEFFSNFKLKEKKTRVTDDLTMNLDNDPLYSTKNKYPEFNDSFTFTNDVEEYNKEILYRSRESFDILNDLYLRSSKSTKSGIWLGKMIQDKEEAIKELESSKSKQVFSYVLYGDEDKMSDSFGQAEIKAVIFDNLSKKKWAPINIDCKNIKKYSPQIIKSVYSDNAGQWIGYTKNEYDNLKKIIEDAIKTTDRFITYMKPGQKAGDFENDINNRNREMGQKEFYGPAYVASYGARCKDIITVLISISAVMNNMIADMYKKDVSLVCRIINKYYKLSKNEKKSVYPDEKTFSFEDEFSKPAFND